MWGGQLLTLREAKLVAHETVSGMYHMLSAHIIYIRIICVFFLFFLKVKG